MDLSAEAERGASGRLRRARKALHERLARARGSCAEYRRLDHQRKEPALHPSAEA